MRFAFFQKQHRYFRVPEVDTPGGTHSSGPYARYALTFTQYFWVMQSVELVT